MIDAGLTPRDPVRWFLAYEIESALAEQTGDGDDIEVLQDAHGTPTL